MTSTVWLVADADVAGRSRDLNVLGLAVATVWGMLFSCREMVLRAFAQPGIGSSGHKESVREDNQPRQDHCVHHCRSLHETFTPHGTAAYDSAVVSRRTERGLSLSSSAKTNPLEA